MEPGQQMAITVDLIEQHGGLATFKGKGETNGNTAVFAKTLASTPAAASPDPYGKCVVPICKRSAS